MAGVSGQGRLLPARLQREKVAPPPVLFQLCRQKKQGRRGGLLREMVLKRAETKQEKEIFMLSVAWVPPPKARALTPLQGNRQRLAGASPGEAQGLFNTYADHPAVPKISVPWQCLSLTSSAVKLCAAAEGNKMVNTGHRYVLGAGAPRRAGCSSWDGELCDNSGPEPCHSIYPKLPLPCDQKQSGIAAAAGIIIIHMSSLLATAGL